MPDGYSHLLAFLEIRSQVIFVRRGRGIFSILKEQYRAISDF